MKRGLMGGVLATVLVSGLALAHGGMMGGGYGPGMMGDGYGPGMMGGGYGPGMMGGGYGPGMMGGGYGPGMMGGGYGPGMMGGALPFGDERLLNDDQRRQIRRIQGEFYKSQQPLMERLHERMETLYELYGDEKADPARAGDVYTEVFKLRREMADNARQARERVYRIIEQAGDAGGSP
ncbi:MULTISPECIES: hypothetical protein [unclassified Modicisalibacter]|uniref:Spy/CpxP family protein refolding chaperone n=1 Tax=unclassified Modicisalibacter TaxID=2679913 RepID=UPI001CCBCD14|nr:MULTISPECIES: hypothetical protein [unclassified Modicisalibacter]MBZ9558362.1 hypothetical protein [Modicisalibacter sp. R2A 31.J]MBZ9575746.1 hypothetical protein [Modicisalibacter sp. MOD 31.J]